MTKNFKRVSVVLAALGVSSTMLATMPIQKDAQKAFPDAKSIKCGTCHTASPVKKENAKEMTAYGKSVAANPVKDKDGKVTGYDWKKIGSPEKPAN